MDFGDVWLALGIDLNLLQGALMFLYKHDEQFQVIEEAHQYHLELVAPLIEARPACGDKPYRIGLHLVGTITLGDDPTQQMFDAWVRLQPGKGIDPTDMKPKGTLSFVEVEGVIPAVAHDKLVENFQPTGGVGKVLADFHFDVFSDLLEEATRVIHPPLHDDDEVTVDPDEFEFDFWPGQPASLRRPVYVVRGDEPVIDLDVADVTVPALVATVSLAGTSARMVGDPSIVRFGTGLQLVTTKAMFDAKLDLQEAAAKVGEIEGLKIDHLDLEAVDSGITVAGAGHKTGGTVTFHGTMVARYQGGTDGHLIMEPAIHTDVDTAGWVIFLEVVGIGLFPMIGIFVSDWLVWGPVHDAPGKLDKALEDKFTEPLVDAASQLATGFGVDMIPSAAFLSDVWFFDGNFGVAAAAFLGSTPTDIRGVSYDTAFVVKDPTGTGAHDNRRRPVRSVADVTLTNGQTLAPWQVAALLRDGLIDLPGYHVVHQPLARGGWYLRSNPNDRLDDNLVH